MFAKLTEVNQFVKTEKISFIDLKFANLFGGWHHVTIPARRLGAELMSEGIGFDASSTPGYKSVESGDMIIIPDLSTGFFDPFWDEPTLSFICNIYEADTKERFCRDPRYIATLTEEYLVSSGIATESRWGPEFEYYIFDNVEFHNHNHHSAVQIQSAEAPWKDQSNGSRNGFHMRSHQGYHAMPPLDNLYNIRSETAGIMEQCGIAVKYHHHEVGSSGQVEIEVESGGLTHMGDVVMITKYIAKMVALRHGKTATFMPKPLYDEPGSGMHFHQHLFKDGEPLFYDRNGYGGLSRLAHFYIAGILKHAPSLTGLTNPSTNSYKRLIPGFEAPVNLFFSLANRSSAVRIPKYATTADAKRIEFRTPDATCNPYFAMAAMLLAGIDGIRQNLDITKEGFGPYDINLFDKANAQIRQEITSVPDNLKSALQHLEADSDYLIKPGIFSESMIKTWIEEKLQNDYLGTRNRPTPFEFQMYYGT